MSDQSLFVSYWLGYRNNGISVPQIPDHVNVINLFLLNLWPDTALNTDSITSDGMTWEEILAGAQTARGRGQKVLASIISTANPDISWNTIADPAAFAAQVSGLIDEWGLDGIDIDPEIGSGAPPNATFIEVVKELGRHFGPESGTGRMMSYASYELPLDKTLLQQTHHLFDYVSLMGYFWPYREMIAQFNDYAEIVGSNKLLFGVSPSGGAVTPLPEAVRLAKWQPTVGRKGGMMEFNINGDKNFAYAHSIHEYMT